MKFKQHVPGFINFEPKEWEIETKEDIFSIRFVKSFEGFGHEFKFLADNTLMVYYDKELHPDKIEKWCLGRLCE